MADELIPLDDPQRCRRSTPMGQCEEKALEGSDFCRSHGGAVKSTAHKQSQFFIDQVRYRQSVEAKMADPAIYSLKEQIGIQNLMLERLTARITRDENILDLFPALDKLNMDLAKLKEQGANLDMKLGNFLTKDVVYGLLDEFVKIMSRHMVENNVMNHEELVFGIVNEFSDLVAETKNE